MTKLLIAAIFALLPIRTLAFDDCDDVEKQELIEGDALRVELMQRKMKQPPTSKAEELQIASGDAMQFGGELNGMELAQGDARVATSNVTLIGGAYHKTGSSMFENT